MSVKENLQLLKQQIPAPVTLVAISKTYPAETILEAYNAGQRVFGENRVQEMEEKEAALPKDIEWHLVGHLQTNKVKYIAPFVKLIHSVDSLKLLEEIDRQAAKHKRVIDCLLQIHIAREETKFGFDFKEAEQLLLSSEIKKLKNISTTGLMGMATNTDDKNLVRNEFKSLFTFYTNLKPHVPSLTSLSMGMSSDYKIAIEEGSTMIRVGSLIFGSRI